ncbi:MAG: type II toxin-antitoxin system VapC family toxin [Chloroflexi bacterium]|nr:type II toxin-antitoxin system VapC family toxin [Chloroflexota bacterium]
MAETPLLVLDASSALQWHFQNGEGANEAVQVMADFSGGQINPIGPHQLAYEFATVVRRYVLGRQLSAAVGERAYARFLSYRIPLMNPPRLLSTAYDYSFIYPVTFYDALYFSLAQIENCQVITLDRPFYDALPPHRRLWLPDYLSPSR